MRKHFYWRRIPNAEYKTMTKFNSFTRNRRTEKNHWKLRLLSLAGPLHFVAIDILGSLAKPKSENKYIIFITDDYFKLTQAIPTAKTTVTRIAITYIEKWVADFGIPLTVLTDNEFNSFPNSLPRSARNSAFKRYQRLNWNVSTRSLNQDSGNIWQYVKKTEPHLCLLWR